MRRHLPLNALRVFEIAARTGSYAEAAAELGLTHGAVSRQIGILEGWLGQRLFIRSGRRMVATPIARVFAAEVSRSFDRLTSAAEACGKPGARRILRVSVPTSFATRWLIPRLERFHSEHPHVEVSVTTVSSVHEELRGGFDVAVETRPGDWIDWLERAGLSHMAGQRRQLFDHFYVTLHAILDGLGLGIGPFPLLDADLASGRLIAPLAHIKLARTGYVALVPFDADKSASLQGFVDWLVAEGKPSDLSA